jgi:DNA-binding Lrp family transcriptional regulator
MQVAEAEAVDVELSDEKKEISKLLNRPYKYGFKTYIESETFPKGLNEDVVRAISAKKGEPDWMLEFRLKAFRKWLTMEEPAWSDNFYPTIDFQNISYYSEPKMKEKKQSLDEVDPELLRTFDKLGIPLNEQKRLANVAVDAVFDSVSIATTFRGELAKAGVIFCSISEAVKEYPELVRKHMGSVVSHHRISSRSKQFKVVASAPSCVSCDCHQHLSKLAGWSQSRQHVSGDTQQQHTIITGRANTCGTRNTYGTL